MFSFVCVSALIHLACVCFQVVNHTVKLAADTPLADAVAAKKVVLGESMVTLQEKLHQATDAGADNYQTAVIDYVTESITAVW